MIVIKTHHDPINSSVRRTPPRSKALLTPPHTLCCSASLASRVCADTSSGRCASAHATCTHCYLLAETAAAAAAREWRECGAVSPDVARAAYTAVLRRRWGCTASLHGARLRLATEISH